MAPASIWLFLVHVTVCPAAAQVKPDPPLPVATKVILAGRLPLTVTGANVSPPLLVTVRSNFCPVAPTLKVVGFATIEVTVIFGAGVTLTVSDAVLFA